MKWGRKSQIEETYKLNKYNTCQNTRLFSKEHLSTSIYTHTHPGRQRQTSKKRNSTTKRANFTFTQSTSAENNNKERKKNSSENVFDFCLYFDFGYIFSWFHCLFLLISFEILFAISFFLFCCFVFFILQRMDFLTQTYTDIATCFITIGSVPFLFLFLPILLFLFSVRLSYWQWCMCIFLWRM